MAIFKGKIRQRNSGGTYDYLLPETTIDMVNGLQDELDSVNDKLEEVITLISEFGAVGDGVTDDTNAILSASSSGKRIKFNVGRYLLKTTDIDMVKGTIFEGDNTGQTVLVVDAPSSNYLFKTNLYTGFENIRILFNNRFDGDAILHDSGYISSNNNNTNHFARNNIFKNVEIDFLYKSGYGNGLKILIQNFNDNNISYPSEVASHLVYLNVEDFEVRYGNSCINIEMNQKGTVNRAIWFTASKFINIRADSCLYGLYFTLQNTSNVAIRDVSDILFDKLEVQCQNAGFFDSSPNQTQPIYIKGNSNRSIFCNFNNFTIWDSQNGESGYLENSSISVNNGYLGFTVKRELGFKQGFRLVDSKVDFNQDVDRLRMTAPTGRIVDITPIDGGLQFRDNPDGDNGYIARGQLYEKITPGTNNSMVYLEAYDKANSKEGFIEMGYGTGFKGSTQGIFNVSVKASDGALRHVVNYGSEGLIYNTPEVNKGFYSGNGVYIKYERKTITVNPSNSYVSISVPITEAYTQHPFLMNCVVERIDNGTNATDDVFIRSAYVSSPTTVTVNIKHTKATSMSIVLGIVVAGYKTFPTS